MDFFKIIGSILNIKKETDQKVSFFRWAHLDLNQGPAGYESDALTDWAMSPMIKSNAKVRIFFEIQTKSLEPRQILPENKEESYPHQESGSLADKHIDGTFDRGEFVES